MAEIHISISNSDETSANRQQHFTSSEGDFQRLGNVILGKCWSPIVWRGGIRRKANFLSSDLIALDFDTGEMTIDDAILWVKQMEMSYIIATTKSHQIIKGDKPACDRFRLILLADHCRNLDDFEYTMKVYSQNLPCDPACKDGGRFYYPCTSVVAAGEGLVVKWLKCPRDETASAQFARDAAFYKSKHRDINFPRYIMGPLLNGVEKNREMTAHTMGYYFARTGWTLEEAIGFFKDFDSPILRGIGEKEVRHALSTAYRHVTMTGKKEETTTQTKTERGENNATN